MTSFINVFKIILLLYKASGLLLIRTSVVYCVFAIGTLCNLYHSNPNQLNFRYRGMPPSVWRCNETPMEIRVRMYFEAIHQKMKKKSIPFWLVFSITLSFICYIGTKNKLLMTKLEFLRNEILFLWILSMRIPHQLIFKQKTLLNLWVSRRSLHIGKIHKSKIHSYWEVADTVVL